LITSGRMQSKSATSRTRQPPANNNVSRISILIFFSVRFSFPVLFIYCVSLFVFSLH
jgi:hypothetical protein